MRKLAYVGSWKRSMVVRNRSESLRDQRRVSYETRRVTRIDTDQVTQRREWRCFSTAS